MEDEDNSLMIAEAEARLSNLYNIEDADERQILR
jgi:hypothetical protein